MISNQKGKTGPLGGLLLLVLGVVLVAAGIFLSRPANHETPSIEPPPAVVAPPEATPTTPQPEQAAPQEAAAPTPAEPEYKPVMQPEGRTIGKPDAPVKIIEYASLTCGHCAHFHNAILDELRVKYIDTGKVQITFREFPLNKPALDAAKILNCMPEKQYYPFMAMLFETQEHWAFTADYLTLLRQKAGLAGMDSKKFDSCLADTVAERQLVADMQAAGAKYKIASTPSFVINDGQAVVVGAQPVAGFARIIDPILDGKPAPTDATATPDQPTEKPAP